MALAIGGVVHSMSSKSRPKSQLKGPKSRKSKKSKKKASRRK